MRRCVAPVIVSLILASCASETPPLDPEIVPLPRPAPKSLAAPPQSGSAAPTSSEITISAARTLAASSAASER